MSEYNLQQVKADLDTIRAAAGISQGPTRSDLLGNFLIALAGVIVAGQAALSHGVWQVAGFVATLLPLGYIFWQRLRHQKDKGGSPQVRQEFRASASVLALAAPFVAYTLWALRMRIPPLLVLATTVFFVGTLIFPGLIANPRNLALAPWCMAFMAGALVIPSTSLSPVTVIGFMLTAGGCASAGIIAIQLRREAGHGFAG